MDRGPGLVKLIRARSQSEAQVVAALLRGRGIHVYIDGHLLQDEFAMYLKVTGQMGLVIQVPRSQQEEAREILAEARRRGEELGEELNGDPRGDPP